MGGLPFGLRRLAIKACGTPRTILQHGESKFAATDRVILVPGPDDEVATVRRVYSFYMEHGFSERAIVRQLNAEKIRNEWGRPWTHDMVNTILTNVKYYGALAYNRRTGKLSKLRTQLAQEAGMSIPAFHSHFKAITQASPMQYLKSTRLHQARLLMVRQDLTAAAACYAVGYTSSSQFSREFRRLFGLPPAAEARRMRENFAIPPAFPGVEFVSSH